MPKVSVIIPAYNAEKYIEQCLASVSAQTLEDIEVIAVDDGSTDATRDVISAAAEADSRIILVEQTNQYAGVARNNGMNRATGEFLYFLDADDYIEPETLEVMVASAEQYGTDIVVAKSEAFDAQTGDTWTIDFALNGQPYETAIPNAVYNPALFQSFNGWPWDKLYRTSFVKDTGYEYQPLRTTNDAFFCWCTLAVANSISCVDRILFHHRSNNNSSLEGSRDKSWPNAIEAITSVADELQRVEASESCINSFHNWVLNYSIWTIQTLPEDSAEEYLRRITPYIDTFDKEIRYPAICNSIFIHMYKSANVSGIKADTMLVDSICRKATRLEEELKQAQEQISAGMRTQRDLETKIENVYNSHSYRLGNIFIKPFSRLKKSHDQN